MIVVMGATGHTGKGIAQAVLKAGRKLRVLGRSADKLADFAKQGAEVQAGDASDAAYLARAFRGADAVYTLIPPNPTAPDFPAYQDRIGEATARAIRESGVKHVLFLSSVGAQHASGVGPIAGLHRQEARLAAIDGLNAVFLRPAYFMENVYAVLGMIKHQGINGGAIAGDVPFAAIATRDISDAAAPLLLSRDFRGAGVRELLGPRDYTNEELTKILGAKIGKPDLAYVQFPYDAFSGALQQMGLSKSIADLYADMSRGFNEGRVRPVEGRNARTTTPTTFESFADELAAAYKAM
jgi:uncharacterized protein YbjT (DUF2867 family)